MRIDLLATEPHYLAHLAPLVDAIEAPPRDRGDVHVVIPEPSSSRAIAHFRTLAMAVDLGLPVAASLSGAPVVVASYADQQLARTMGARRIVVMEHGIGQSYGSTHPSYPGGRGRDGAALFLTPNEHSADRWRQTYPTTPVRVIGSPRLNYLPARGPALGIQQRPTVAVAFHWACPVARPWAGTAFGEYRSSLADLSREYEVIGHGHPRAIDGLTSWYRQGGIEVVRDSDDVMRRADVLVADNTSLLYEFAATGRPVVVLNSRLWTRDVDLGLRFWDAAGVGINVERASEVVGAVGQALEDPGDVRLAREHALDIVYAYRSGAAERAVGAIAELAGVPA